MVKCPEVNNAVIKVISGVEVTVFMEHRISTPVVWKYTLMYIMYIFCILWYESGMTAFRLQILLVLKTV